MVVIVPPALGGAEPGSPGATETTMATKQKTVTVQIDARSRLAFEASYSGLDEGERFNTSMRVEILDRESGEWREPKTPRELDRVDRKVQLLARSVAFYAEWYGEHLMDRAARS